MFSNPKSRKSLAHTPVARGSVGRPPRTPFSQARSTGHPSTSGVNTTGKKSNLGTSATPGNTSINKQLDLSNTSFTGASPFASGPARRSPFTAGPKSTTTTATGLNSSFSHGGDALSASFGGATAANTSALSAALPPTTPNRRAAVPPTTPASTSALARTSLSKYVMSSPAVSHALQSANYTPHVTDKMNTEEDAQSTALPSSTPHQQQNGGKVLHENDRHLVERYGNVPPAITELLPTLAGEGSNPSTPPARMGSGFAWAVSSGMVYVWPIRARTPIHWVFRFPGVRASAPRPHARLVCVTSALDAEGTPPPALLCSQEGHLAFIPNIGDTGDAIEVTLPLNTGDRVRLVEPSIPTGYVVVTEYAQIYHVTVADDEQSLSFRHLQKATGVLVGLMGIFGRGSATPTSKPSKHLSVVARHTSRDTCELILLTDTTIEKWDLSDTYDKFIYEHQLSESVKPLLEESSYQMEIEAAEEDGLDPGPRPDLDVYPLGVRHIGSHGMLLLLVATVQTNVSPGYVTAIRYTFIEVDARSNPPTITEGVSLGYEPDFAPEVVEEAIHGAQFVVPGRGPSALVAWKQLVVTSSVPEDDRDLDTVPTFQHGMNRVLAIGELGYRGLVLSASHGIVSITDSESRAEHAGDLDASFDDVSHYPMYQTPAATPGGGEHVNLLRAGQLPSDVSTAELLTSAFRMYCTQQKKAALVMGAELVAGSRDYDFDSVVELSTQLLNVRPVSNPHWAESMTGPSSASSLILQHQLEDKRQKHFLLIEFLQEIDMWDLLPASIRNVVAHHGEKIAAAIALRAYQNVSAESGREASTLQHMAMDLALRSGNNTAPDDAGLSLQDLFFSDVASIDRILPFSVEAERQRLQAVRSLGERMTIIKDTNEVFQVIMVAAIQHRALNKKVYATADEQNAMRAEKKAGGAPHAAVSSLWTTGNESIQQSLRHQLQSTDTLISELSNDEERASLFDQLHVLSELFLSVYYDILDENSTPDEVANFNNLRTSVMQIFISNNEYEHAVALAERFRDFYSLVRLCEGRGDRDRIAKFMKEYHTEGFPQELFTYYHESGKLVDLIRQDDAYWADLKEFLKDKPELSWIHSVRTQDYSHASDVLKQLAAREQESALTKKNMLSISKLAALASGASPEDVARTSDDLFVIYAQEYLSNAAPGEDMPPRSADDLVSMLIGPDNARPEGMVLQDSERFFFAIEVYEHSVATRSAEQNRNLLLQLWQQAVACKDWADLAKSLSSNAADHLVAQEIEESVVMTLAKNSVGSGRLTPEIADAILNNTDAQQRGLIHRVLHMALGATAASMNTQS